jgi:hypothetical protein
VVLRVTEPVEVLFYIGRVSSRQSN